MPFVFQSTKISKYFSTHGFISLKKYNLQQNSIVNCCHFTYTLMNYTFTFSFNCPTIFLNYNNQYTGNIRSAKVSHPSFSLPITCFKEVVMDQNLENNDSSKSNVNIKAMRVTKTGEYTPSNEGNLTKHLKTHSGEKSKKCSQCNYASLYAGGLRTHLKTHSGEKSIKCNQCDFTPPFRHLSGSQRIGNRQM